MKLHLYLLAVIQFLIAISFPHSNYCLHTYNELAVYHPPLLMQCNATSLFSCAEWAEN